MDTIQAIGKWLAGEGRVIIDAPVAFLISVALVGLLIFFALKAFFRERIEVLEARLGHTQDIANEYKSKLQGATPDEAARALRELQARVGALEPRRLNEQQRRLLREILARSKERHVVEVAYDGSCADARGYQADLANLLAEMGWQVSTPMVIGPSVSPPSGLAVSVPEELPPEAKLLTDGLREAKIEFDLYRNRARGVTVTITSPNRR